MLFVVRQEQRGNERRSTLNTENNVCSSADAQWGVYKSGCAYADKTVATYGTLLPVSFNDERNNSEKQIDQSTKVRLMNSNKCEETRQIEFVLSIFCLISEQEVLAQSFVAMFPCLLLLF